MIRRDADDELEALLEERVDYLIARGMTPKAARAEAIRRMGGDMEAARERVRQSAARRERAAGLREWFGGVRDDIRYALRGLAREPLFTSFAILTLALGIGANAAMFGLVDRLLLRGPAHVREPGRVVRLYWQLRQPGGEISTSAAFDPRVYANLVAEARVFSGLAMETGAQHTTLIGEGLNARLVASARGTSNLMSVLGTRPAIGRFFTLDEQETDTPPPVVVLGYGLWPTKYCCRHRTRRVHRRGARARRRLAPIARQNRSRRSKVGTGLLRGAIHCRAPPHRSLGRRGRA